MEALFALSIAVMMAYASAGIKKGAAVQNVRMNQQIQLGMFFQDIKETVSSIAACSRAVSPRSTARQEIDLVTRNQPFKLYQPGTADVMVEAGTVVGDYKIVEFYIEGLPTATTDKNVVPGVSERHHLQLQLVAKYFRVDSSSGQAVGGTKRVHFPIIVVSDRRGLNPSEASVIDSCYVQASPNNCEPGNGIQNPDISPNGRGMIPYAEGREGDEGDSVVNIADMGRLVGSWGPCTATCFGDGDCAENHWPECEEADLNTDGEVNDMDLDILLENWGVCI